MEYDGEIAGQLNVWGIARGSLSSATIGYWVSERFAGRGITPTAVALATDVCFRELGLHRMEICIRPENGRVCGSSRSWASVTRAAAAIHPHRGRLARPLRVRAGARGGSRRRVQRGAGSCARVRRPCRSPTAPPADPSQRGRGRETFRFDMKVRHAVGCRPIASPRPYRGDMGGQVLGGGVSSSSPWRCG
jgi:hypothetical protein